MNKSYSSKKAQGLSLDMIVIGAIGLVVLVIVITIFRGGMVGVVEDLDDKTCCSTKNKMTYGCDKVVGGNIKIGSCGSTEEIAIGDFVDVSAVGGQVCCVPKAAMSPAR